MQNLALQVGYVYGVEVDDPYGPYSCQRQVERDRGAQAARADHKDPCAQHFSLADAAHVGHYEMAAVPLNLARCQRLIEGHCVPHS